ncbi:MULTISPECIES: MASE1 domain-containing protein [unclassified Streptomyces]|uniref:MASE1 domain-containing protein n=1 Tax=unclassified Streptomyces TaxID=2593676 RepID=UPI002DDA430B|nr:MASE1 domain-containing protein [Streptomyces sp. NBC_01445]WSE03352.1 MASE1 domain-containing protein [Streptomyces sp. NBC_01445]
MTAARRERLRRGAAAALEICVVAAVYYGSAKLGLLQQLVRGQVTPLWPPTGIALASLLLRGPRVWPGIALGALVVNISLGPSLPAVLAIVAGNTLAPVCSYALLCRAGFRIELARLRDVLALIFLGAFTGMLVSATIGSGTLALAGVVGADGFWPTWSVWWTGDAMGVLVVTPVLLVLRSARWPKDAPPFRWVEGFLLVAATAGVGLVATGSAPLMFLSFPLLIWAAFRFQLAGAAPCALAVSTFTIIAAARGTGPFTGHDLLTSMITLQAFNGSSALTALLVAAAVSERNQFQQEISQACGYLAEMVAKISAGGYQPTLPLRFGEVNGADEENQLGEVNKVDQEIKLGEVNKADEEIKAGEEDEREGRGGRTGRTA